MSMKKIHKKNIKIKKQKYVVSLKCPDCFDVLTKLKANPAGRFCHDNGSDFSLSSFLFILRYDLRYEVMINVGLARFCIRQISL